jgi:3-oxoacyl-[acyl-carrier-protein] synthase III
MLSGLMRIESLGVYLPERSASTAEVVGPCAGVPASAFERLTGIRARPVAAPDEFSIDMARKAIGECFRRSRFAPATIDLLICCNISRCDGPDDAISVEPSTAVRLKHEFALARALTFDVSNACAGFFTGLLLADIFLKGSGTRRVLVVSGEYTTHLTRTAQLEIRGPFDPRLACLTLGDSGVAVTVERTDRAGVGFHAIDLFTLGSHSGLCVGRLTDRAHGGAIMLTDSRRLTQVAIDAAVPHVFEIIREGGWDPRAIDLFVAHQTAKRALDRARGALNAAWHTPWLDDANYAWNVANRGNLATNSHHVAVHDRALEGRVRPGDRAVYMIPASGLTVGTALYRFDDLPERLRAPAPRRRDTVAEWTGGGGDDFAVDDGACTVRIESVGLAPEGPADGRQVVELARQAAEECLRGSKFARDEVELILFAGVHRDGLLCEPAVAALLAGALGINHDGAGARGRRTLAFDLTSGGVGFLKACLAASRMIGSGRFRNALIVSAENPGPVDSTGRPYHRVVPSGAAVLLEDAAGRRPGFGRFAFRTHGEHSGRQSVRSCGRSGPPALMVTEDPELESIYLDCLVDCLGPLRTTGGLGAPGTGLIPLSPFGPHFARKLVASLGLPEGCLVTGLEHAGTTPTCGFARSWALVSSLRSPGPPPTALFVQAGAGIEVAYAFYRF